MLRRKFLFFIALFVLLVSCSGPLDTKSTRPGVRITILHTNDHHGRFWPNQDGEYGLAARKTLVDEIREQEKAKGGNVLLLSGGDINTGVPESDLQKAEPDFRGMKALEYTAMAVGNHEFDNPLSVIRQQEKWAGFPFLSANIYFADKNERVFRPYTIINIQGKKIGIVGLTTESSYHRFGKEDRRPIEFRSTIDAAREVLAEIKDKTDFIIGVTHLGHEGYGKETTDTEIAAATSGFDVIVGGHSQVPLFQPLRVKDTLILQAGEWGKYVGRLDLRIRESGQVDVAKGNYQLIPVNLKKPGEFARSNNKKVKADKRLEEMLRPYQEKGQKKLSVQVGLLDEAMSGEREIVRKTQAPLGQLVGEAQRAITNADVGMLVGGGLRDGLPAGVLTYRNILLVQPFGNSVVTAELSGAELFDLISETLKERMDFNSYAQFINLKLYLNEGGELVRIKVGDKDLDRESTYKLSADSYMAVVSGLDQHSSFKDTGFNDAHILKEYIEANSPLEKKNFQKQVFFKE